MNNYLIYQNGKPINNQFQNFSEALDFLDTKFKKREVWKKQYIIRIYKKELSKNKMSENLNIKLVNIDTGKTLEKNNPNWTVSFSHENQNIVGKIWDKINHMKSIYVIWDEIRGMVKFDLEKEIKNINFKVIRSGGKVTQHSRLVEFFSDKKNCGKILKYSEVTKLMEKRGLKMVGRGIEGERPREFRYSMGYQFITNDKDRNIPSKHCKVISPFPSTNRNERRNADFDLDKKDWSSTYEILKKNVKRLRCFYCGRFEGEINRIGQKTIFQKGHLQSHFSEGNISKNNIIEQCQYCNTFLSNFFDFDPYTLKANVNALKAVEKSTIKEKLEILRKLLNNYLRPDETKEILNNFLKKR